MFGFRKWRQRRILKHYPLAERDWKWAVSQSELLQGLGVARQAQLRELATLFAYHKDFYPVGGMEMSPNQITLLSAVACVPVLGLDAKWLEGWHSIYIYPGQFRTRRVVRNEYGLEREDHRVLSGEAHHAGGLVLSWEDVINDLDDPEDGSNVIVHEIAHKLDMRNGSADGYPPLPRSMRTSNWAKAMRAEYDALNEQLDRRQRPVIDPYAATNPAEFFAVISEYFFERPKFLRKVMPTVFELLVRFYKQDPTEYVN